MKLLHIIAAALLFGGFFLTVSTVESAPHIACAGVAMAGIACLIANALDRAERPR